MSLLDSVLPEPRLLELDHVDLALPPADAFARVRHLDFGRSPIVRALFAVRTLPTRLAGEAIEPLSLRIDDITSRVEPGFRILAESPLELVVGAIGKVWELDIPFVAIDEAAQFRAFEEAGFVKVAWALRALPRGDRDARLEFEVRVDATDDASWARFRRYFALIGPGSHFIRRHLLSLLAKDVGAPEAHEDERPLDGDSLLADAAAQLTHGVTLRAKPEAIWPWLVQLGCRRAGFYSYDLLDNGGARSAREIHPELQDLAVGDVIPASPDSDEGFEVLALEPPHTLILGGLFDAEQRRQLPFASPRPERFWQTTWAFVLEPLDAETTRLHVRARAALSPDERLHALWIRPVHHFMERAQLHGLAQRVEGTLPKDDARDVLEGVAGAAEMALVLLTPFLRGARAHHGLSTELAERDHPGDALVPEPRWSWTHGIEIDAPAEAVWPWIAQLGVGRGGFYSYQWLENVAGCEIRNAEVIHPEWALRAGDELRLHPDMPPLVIERAEPARALVAFGPPDERARSAGKPWTSVSWLFFLEPLSPTRTRLVSRFRAACSDDVATRFAMGPFVTGSIGHVMDLKMLRGVKERAERGPDSSVG